MSKITIEVEEDALREVLNLAYRANDYEEQITDKLLSLSVRMAALDAVRASRKKIAVVHDAMSK